MLWQDNFEVKVDLEELDRDGKNIVYLVAGPSDLSQTVIGKEKNLKLT